MKHLEFFKFLIFFAITSNCVSSFSYPEKRKEAARFKTESFSSTASINPNPVLRGSNITINTALHESQLDVYDYMQTIIVIKFFTNPINTSSMSAGTYISQVIKADGTRFFEPFFVID